MPTRYSAIVTFYEVPNFQRPYEWTIKQASELLDDVLNFVSSGDKAIKVNDLDPYFLGSIVLIKDEDAPEAKVVDRQ